MARPTRTILVTGASGFVGYHVVAALHGAGFAVRCLVRPTSRLEFIDSFGPEKIQGDVTRPESLPAAVRGVEAVVHCAGLTRAVRPEAFFAVNAEGTRHVCEACAQVEPPRPRLILIGSLAALGPAAGPEAPVTEDREPQPVGAYGRSKLAGQRIAISFRDRLAVTVLLPPAVYGPADVDFLNYFRLIRRGVAPLVGRQTRTLSMLHAEDLARAAVLCLQKPANPQREYLLEDGAPHPWDDVVAAISRAVDRTPRAIRVPEWLVRVLGRFGGWWGSLTGRPPVLNPERLREFLPPCWVCSGRRIRDELGFAPRFDLDAGLRQTGSWYREHGWI